VLWGASDDHHILTQADARRELFGPGYPNMIDQFTAHPSGPGRAECR
jgi:hypothetical protein